MRKYTIKEQLDSETGKQKETLFAEDILEDNTINKKIIAKIRERYGENEEIKMLRLGILDGLNKDFQAYNKYVEECQTWGNEKKAEATQERIFWKDKYRRRNESEKDSISRLKLVLTDKPIALEK